MKKKVLKIFLMGMLKSMLIIALMIAAGLGGYFATRAYYVKHPEDIKKTEENIDDIIADAQIDEVSKNLIYVSNSKNGNVKYCVIEIFDTETGNMDYITIPRESRITISPELYQKLCVVDSEIPQIMTVAQIYNYFDDEASYAYGVNIFEDYFGIDISYYSVIPFEVFKEDFRYVKTRISYNKKVTAEDGTESEQKMKENVRIVKLRKSYKQKLRQFRDVEALGKYIEGYYEKMYSNLSLYDKLGYVEKYLQLDLSMIHYYCMPGEYDGKYYMIDGDAAAKLVRKLDGQAAYTGKQEKLETPAPDSIDSIISVLNGSQISGVAAGYQQVLEEAGYIIEEIGNYEEEVLADTKIIVREEGEGEDLKTFFTNPVVEVGVPPEGIDIQIIVGTADAGEVTQNP